MISLYGLETTRETLRLFRLMDGVDETDDF